MKENTKVLIIGKVWPEPDSSAAGHRIVQLIRFFSEQDWDITFASAARRSYYSENLNELKVEEIEIKLNDSSFDAFVKKLDPTLVLFDRFMTEEQFGWRVAEQCPNALRILDTEDLHCLRAGRHRALKEGRSFIENDLISDYAKREIASIYRCDLSLIISEYEAKLLKEVFGVNENLLQYTPFMLEKVYDSTWSGFEDRDGFISIGNFLHDPNWDAVLYLRNTIWPLIREQFSDAEINIYGAYPSQKVFQLHNPKEGFLIKGRAEDASDVVSSSKVMLAPLRFGAGLKGKLVEAIQCGTPSITTSIGAEGMYGDLPWPGAIEESPEEFAKSAIRLYREKPDWSRAQKKGVQIISQRFSKKEIGTRLLKRILEMNNQLEEHRQKNFMGAMLLYHSMASTKFMGKWIEEKNKLFI